MNPIILCLCCLKRPPDKDVKTPYTYHSITEIYSDMIKDCFEIQLTLPTKNECGICDECVGRLRDARDFRLQVQRSQRELRARLGTDLSFKHEIPVKSEMVQEGLSTDGEVLYEPRVNPPAIGAPAAVWGVAPGPSEPRSPTCHDTFLHEASLATHARDVHGDSCAVRHEDTYTCDTCGEQLKNKPSLINHVKEHKGLSYVKSSKSNDRVKHTCEQCKKQFNRKCDLLIHQTIHTTDKPYTCDLCQKLFARRSYLRNHIIRHMERTYSCIICSMQFNDKVDLIVHKRVHTGDKTFKCDVCNKEFTRKQNLVAHKRMHDAIDLFNCEVCHKQFNRKGNLTVHRRTHTGDKPFACEICNKQFAAKGNLAVHQRCHKRNN